MSIIPRINPNTNETTTVPKSHTHPSHEGDGLARDPEATTAPPTPKPTLKVKALVRTPTTIVSRREEDDALRKWSLSRYCCVRCILKLKQKSEVPQRKPRTYVPKIGEAPTGPEPHTHPSHQKTPRPSTPSSSLGSTSSSVLTFSRHIAFLAKERKEKKKESRDLYQLS
jgi:hypothetical protein